MDIKIEVWKESGKWYTTENVELEILEDVEPFLKKRERFKGMNVTVYYFVRGVERYFQPYRMFKL